MKIRTKLTLIFFAIVIVILSVVSVAIYFFSSEYREQEFYTRLRNKAENTAKLLIEFDEVSPDLLKRIERANPGNLPNERIRIYNFRNEELYSSDNEWTIPVDARLLDEIRLEEEVRFRHNDDEVLGFLFAHQFDRFTVVAAATDIYGFKKIENLKTILLSVFVISLFLISVAGWVYVGRMLRPVSNLVKEVGKISSTSLDRRLDVGNGKDELAQLAQTFNLMLARLEAAFLTQKHFIANASHELRTPITAIAGEIEVALLQPRPPEEYIKVLKSLLEDTRKLGALSTQLLLLAQTSSGNQPRSFATLRIDELLWEAKDDLVRANKGYTINILFEGDLSDDDMMVSCDGQLIKIVFINLMDNGCKYSSDAVVVVTLRRNDGFLSVTFDNSGIGIDPEEMKRIFDPFVRGTNTGSVKGFGVGLSLASQIMKLHGGTLEAQSGTEGNTRFIVLFPRGKKN